MGKDVQLEPMMFESCPGAESSKMSNAYGVCSVWLVAHLV